MNKDFKAIEMTSKFSNFKVLNPDFTRCRCNVFYTGRNRNHSDITRLALDRLIARNGYANIPVVGNIKTNKDGKKVMGSHDRKIVITNDGIQEINETIPMGVVPEDCNPSIEKITDIHGIEHDYFCVDLILWTHYFPELMEVTYDNEIYFNHSMEIRMEDIVYDEDYVVVNDFSLQALCLLGKYDNTHGSIEDNQEPCFEDSVVKRFSVNENTFIQNFNLMLEKLKQCKQCSTGSNNVISNKKVKGDNSKMELKNFVKTLSDAKSDINAEYALLSVDDSKVFVLDKADYKPYGFNYAITKAEDGSETIVIDFESKEEMSLSAVNKITEENFDEFSISNEIQFASEKAVKDEVKNVTELLSEKFTKDYNELKEAYEDLQKSFNLVSDKLDVYVKKEEIEKEKAHKDSIDKLVDSYSKKIGKYSKYLIYKAQIEEKYALTYEQVEQDLILMAGQFLTKGDKSSFSYEPIESNPVVKETSVNKYGHLLDKYIR